MLAACKTGKSNELLNKKLMKGVLYMKIILF